MRILLAADPILPVPPEKYGGIERVVDGLVGELRRRGHEVGLLAKRGSTCVADHSHAWPCDAVWGRVATFRNALALRRAARSMKADVVHSFARLAYLLPMLPLSQAKIMSYQRHPGVRQIRWARRFSRLSTLRFTGCSDFIVNMGRVSGTRWRSIPNFVDVDRIPFTTTVAPDAPLLFLSRVESIKGPDLAIEIARRAGRRLIIAGNRAFSGPESNFFEKSIAPHIATGGVDYVGEVDDAAKYALLTQSAGLLLPLRWDEPFGIVLIEALAAGTPAIVFARGAAPEIITHGRTGFLVKNVEEARLAVEKLPTLRRAECRTNAEQRYSLSVCTSQYEVLYRDLLAATRAQLA